MLEQCLLPLPFLEPLSQKEKLGLEIPSLARRINHLLCSVKLLPKPMKMTGQREIENFCPIYLFFSFLRVCVCVCVCVCVLEITKETGM